ncbi:hypothetical protein [Streptomyces antimycoticus]|uniref:hypothetical protein n=1 Tax=Streptomyces antimycoticus TaxID=68175 RepID=UPI0010F96ABF|nr:hypothetical protein [Streptomyces antimycoticus]
MTVGVPHRGGRAGWWALAGLVTALATLVHLLVCAHGPQRAGGADSLSAVRSAATAPVTAGDLPRAADGDAASRCHDGDQPGWVQQNYPLVFPGAVAASGAAFASDDVPPPGWQARAGGGKRAPPAGGRAVLGVWRI